MEALNITLGIGLPVILGGVWICAIVPVCTEARVAVVTGYGSMFGLLLITIVMRGLDLFAIPFSFATIAWAAVGLTLLGCIVLFILTRAPRKYCGAKVGFLAMSVLQQVLFFLILFLILVRVFSLGVEVIWRPLFPWDATMHWATKARVWYEFNSIVPFVTHLDWLRAEGKGVFTDAAPYYSSTIPLLQVWMNLALGRWDGSLMNLPWITCYISLGLIFYGQLRISGIERTIAIAFTYFLLSMPLLNTQVALAGHADLFLGTAYCAALTALHNYNLKRQHWLAALGIIFAISCPLIKNEGFIWMITLLPAITATRGRAKITAGILLFLALGLIVSTIFLPKGIHFYGYTLGQFKPAFNVGVLSSIGASIWVHDSWHLLGYLLVAVFVLALLIPRSVIRTYIGVIVTLACAVSLTLFLFLFTGFGRGALNFSGISRVFLQFVPSLLFICALLFNEFIRNTQRSQNAEMRAADDKNHTVTRVTKRMHPN